MPEVPTSTLSRRDESTLLNIRPLYLSVSRGPIAASLHQGDVPLLVQRPDLDLRDVLLEDQHLHRPHGLEPVGRRADRLLDSSRVDLQVLALDSRYRYQRLQARQR